MLLSDLTFPLPYEECKDLALVYDYATASQWYTIQQEHGDPRHVAGGKQLADGRWMMGGHLLSELHEGGILAWALPHLTPEWMASVEVVPIGDVVGLLPTPDTQP